MFYSDAHGACVQCDFLGASLPDQLASLQSMSPGSTSPSQPIAGGSTSLQQTHGIDQLAQASMQSPRLATQATLYNNLSFGDANEINRNGINYPLGLNTTDSSEIMNAVHGAAGTNIKQE